MDSKVYYMDARSNSPQTSLVAKMIAVFEAAGFEKAHQAGRLRRYQTPLWGVE